MKKTLSVLFVIITVFFYFKSSGLVFSQEKTWTIKATAICANNQQPTTHVTRLYGWSGSGSPSSPLDLAIGDPADTAAIGTHTYIWNYSGAYSYNFVCFGMDDGTATGNIKPACSSSMTGLDCTDDPYCNDLGYTTTRDVNLCNLNHSDNSSLQEKYCQGGSSYKWLQTDPPPNGDYVIYFQAPDSWCLTPTTTPIPAAAATATPTPIPVNPPNCPKKAQGDANCDGVVNDADYTIWRCEFIGNGTCVSPASTKSADFNSDQSVMLKDFEIWRKNKFLTPASWTCGNTFTKNHTTAGGVAPVNKTVVYGTVLSNIGSTGTKCWITQNLGATDQASSATDSDEASAGWYWQFNKKQGYKYDGTTRIPNTTWIYNNNESSNWISANDPCTLELGAGWRLPTSAEWTNIDNSQGLDNHTEAYASILKLHDAGYIRHDSGGLYGRGAYGLYWSSTQQIITDGWNLNFTGSFSNVDIYKKAAGFTVRCIKD